MRDDAVRGDEDDDVRDDAVRGDNTCGDAAGGGGSASCGSSSSDGPGTPAGGAEAEMVPYSASEGLPTRRCQRPVRIDPFSAGGD